jgi:hypothetical protein
MKHLRALLLAIPLLAPSAWACKIKAPGPSSFEHLQADAKVFLGTVRSVTLGPCQAESQYVESTIEFAVERAWQDRTAKIISVKGPMLNEKCAAPTSSHGPIADCVDVAPYERIQALPGQKAFLVAAEQNLELRSRVFFALNGEAAHEDSRAIWDLVRKQRGNGTMPR